MVAPIERVPTVRVTLQYVPGCRHRDLIEARLRQTIDRSGAQVETITAELVDTPEAAERLGFHGSPTILIDGHDPFEDESVAVGFACRLYQTEVGPDGAPSAAQLEAALGRLPTITGCTNSTAT